MAGDIRGITIELSADGSKINSVLKEINSASKTTAAQLKAVKNSLKFNYNGNDMAKAMELSAKKVEFAKNKVDQLQIAMDNLQKSDKATPKTVSDMDTEISKAKNSLRAAEAEYKKLGKMKLEIETKEFQSNLDESKKKISATKQELDILKDKLNVKFDDDTFQEATQKSQQYMKELRQEAALYEKQLKTMQAAGVDLDSSEYREIEAALADVNNQAQQANKALKEMAFIKLDQISNSLQKTGQKIDTIGTKLTNSVTVPLLAAGTAAVTSAVSFENNFANVEKTVDATEEELAVIRKGIIDISNNAPISTEKLNEIAAAAGQLGIRKDNILKFSEVMFKLETASNIAGESGAANLAKFANITQMSQEYFDRLGSTIVDLGNNSATTENDILEMGMKIASAGTQAKMSHADIMGIAAALSSVGLESDAGGSAFSKLIAKMQIAVEKGGDSLTQFAKVSNMSVDEFKESFNKDAAKTFMEFFKGLGDTERLGKSTIAMLDEMGLQELRLSDMIRRASNSNELFSDSLERSRNAWEQNSALNTEYEKKLEKTAAQLQIAKNNIINSGAALGEVLLPSITDASGKVADFTQKLAELDDESKDTIVTWGLVAASIGPAFKIAGKGLEAAGKIAKGINLLKKMPPVYTKTGLAIAGVALALGLAKKAYDSYENAQLNASKRALEYSQSTLEATDSLKELSSLQEEYKSLTGKLEKGGLSSEEADSAKARLEEIKKLLSEKYKVDLDSTDIDFAIEKAKKLAELKALQDKDKTVQELNSSENADDVTKRINQNERLKKSYEEQTLKVADAREEVEELRQEYTKLSETEQWNKKSDYEKRLKEIVEGTGLFENRDYSGTLFTGATTDLLDAFDDLEKKAKNLREEISKDKEVLNNTQQAAKNLAEVGFAEIKKGSIQQGLDDIALAVKKGGLAADEYAMKAAAAQNGLSSFSELAGKAPEAFNKAVTDYQNAAKQFGASGEEIAVGSVLIQNGFDSIQQAADAGMLDVLTQQANDLAHSMGLLPPNKRIVINADGDISVLYQAVEEIELLDGRKATVKLDANGKPAMMVIDGVEYAVDNYNILTGVAQLTAEDGSTAVVNVAINNIENIPKEHETDITAKDLTAEGIQSAQRSLSNVDDKVVKITVKTVLGNDPTAAFANFGKATGDQNFKGGMALVNDQNVPDPRELIIDKGKAYIPQGRNVLVNLSQGAKVYTAYQTKQIMKNIGIPNYASGKSNTPLDLRNEANELSEEYIGERIYLNDWESFADNAIAAFNRVQKRENQFVKDGTVTAKESADFMKQLGESMLSDRIANSEAWLDREIKYNGLSLEGQKEAYERMKQYTQEFFDNGIVSFKEYITAMQDFADKQRDIELEAIDKRVSDSKAWIDKMDFYDLWDKQGDNAVDAYGRMKKYLDEYLAQGKLSWEQYMEYVEEIQKEIYSICKESYEDTMEAMEEAYEDRVDRLEEALDKSLDNIDDAADKQKEHIEANYKARISAIQGEIDALEELKEAREEADEISKAQKELLAAKTLLEYSRDVDEQAELYKEVLRKQQALDDLLSEQATNAQKKELENQITTLENELENALLEVDTWNEEQRARAKRQYSKSVRNATDAYIKQQYDYTAAIANGESTWAAVSSYYNNSSYVNNNTYNNGNNSFTVNNNGQNMTMSQLKQLFYSLFGRY